MLTSGEQSARGFTIIELMIVVVILAVLAAIAVPNLRSFIVGQRIKTASFDLYSTMLFARSEAIKRSGGTVRVTPVSSSNWALGWTTSFVPSSGSAVILRQMDALADIEIVDPAANSYIEFRHDGHPGVALALSLQSSSVPSAQGRCIYVALTGSASTKVRPASGC